MKLHRFASVSYGEALGADWSSFGCTADDVVVKAWPAETREHGAVLAHFVDANIRISWSPGSTGCEFLDPARLKCERGIEILANHIALFNRVRRVVLSIDPPIAVEPESAEDRAVLKGAVFDRSVAIDMQFLERQVPTIDELSGLSDRIEGVDLMAEVYAHSSDSGCFRDYVRFFEAAFRKPFTVMAKKLAQTLDPRMEYTQVEIKRWIEHRHPLTHADGAAREVLSGELAVRPLMRRMEQAALDMLFNKATWGTWCSDRRNLRLLSSYSRGLDARWTTDAAAGVHLAFSMLDEFGVYKKGKFRLTMPEDWAALSQFSASPRDS